ncbi:MAG: CDP-alcohol phosphatidyltransferase family protein [Defluviitaleaceae bacterium]|nr:CDP-alcohol phosphatidyltransferase family protein [Defluviitaleaceae bacterium]
MAKYFPVLKHFNTPNAITTLGLVFGIFTCYFLTQRDLRMAIICLFFAGVMDLVDGFVAAKLNQQSKFGQSLDTLVDFFTCCIIPVWMVHDMLSDLPLYPLIVAAMIFYVMCGLWRLALYNITGGGKSFTGLPVPGAMMLITIVIWCVVMYNITLWVAAIAFLAVGLLMISGIQLPKYGIWQKVMGFSGLAFLGVVIFS